MWRLLYLLFFVLPFLVPGITSAESSNQHPQNQQAMVQSGSTEHQLNLKLQQAEYSLVQGNLEDVQRTLSDARRLNKKSKHNRAADIAVITANLFISQGNYIKAERALIAALGLEKVEGTVKAIILNNLGNIYSYKQHFIEAYQYYQEAKHARDRLSTHFLLKIEINQIRVLLALNRIEKAAVQFDNMLPILEKLPDDNSKPSLLISAANLLNNSRLVLPDARSRAYQYNLLRQAEQIAEYNESPYLHAKALLAIGQMYLTDKRFKESLTLTRQALFKAVNAEATELVIMCHWQMGRVYRQQGAHEHALKSYRQAVSLFDKQSGYRDIEAVSIFRASLGDLLREAADLLLQKATKTQETKLRQRILLEAREVIEKYREDQLYAYYQDECVSQLKSRTTGVENIEKDVLVIYPIILDDRLEILVSGKDLIQQVTVNTPTHGLALAAQNLRSNLEDVASSIYTYSASEVYDWLIRPIEPLLLQYKPKILVFVPNETIQMIPLGALYDGTHFLIEHYAVATTPGLLLTIPQLTPSPMQMLIGATQQAQGNVVALPSAVHEAKILSQKYNVTLLLDDDFTEQKLDQAVSQRIYPIIHLATHSQVDSQEKGTYLLTNDGRMGLDEIQTLLTTGRYQDTPLELLTLSACNTAITDDNRAGLGLGGLAVKSGARTVLASLWRINDEATQVFMDKFYYYLGSDMNNRAQALQQAQQDLLSHPKYQHPAFWSAFILIGSWQ